MNNILGREFSSEYTLWKEKFLTESETLRNIFGSEAMEIEHIGSTAIEGLSGKPIVDMAVLIKSYQDADKFIEPLESLGYRYDKEKSSGERHLFRKGNPTEFHLSIAYSDKGGFWERQILFRDYLRTHPEFREEYEKLKEDLLKKDSVDSETYTSGKTEFVQKILYLAKQD